ncbi:hypothetical protein D3C80_1774540 [compost metagenome]
MGEPENAGGDEAGPGQGQHHRKEAVPGAGAQGCSDFERAVADGGEGILQRLHDKGHRINHRADDQAGETEHHGAQPQGLGSLTDKTMRAQGQQQVKTDHRRWQYQGQGHHRTDGAAQARTRASQPPGDGGADQQ